MKEKTSMFKGFVLGLLTALLVSMMVVPGFAATVAKTITVYTGITLYYDGEKVEPKDANGNKVEPLLYNGTTYLADLTAYESSSLSLPGSLTMDGKTYVNCFKLGDASLTGNKEYASWNLNGQYDTLEFDVGHVLGTDHDKQVILYLDGKAARVINIGAGDLVQHVKVPLDGALRLKIQVEDGFQVGFANAALQ